MNSYEKRLLRELQQAPSFRFTADEWASIWKRSKYDVRTAANSLICHGLIETDGYGHLKLKTIMGTPQ